MPNQLPGPSPNCGQAWHCRADCPTLSRQSKISPPHSSSPGKTSHLLNLVSETYCCPGTSALNAMENTENWDECVDNWLWTCLCNINWYTGHLDYTSCCINPSQISAGIDDWSHCSFASQEQETASSSPKAVGILLLDLELLDLLLTKNRVALLTFKASH